MSAREQWEEVSFQVFEDESGAIRSGYYPTGEGLVSGNIAVDYTYGNFPIQPNDDRSIKLPVGNSHKLAAVEWDSYPTTSKIAANYMVTALEYLGDDVYECTAQNNLKVGDTVLITNSGYFPFPIFETVTYADANRFRFEESGAPAPFKLTGLYGRADVTSDTRGATLEGGEAFYWPNLWICNNGTNFENNKLANVINEFVSYGVPREYFVDFTFSGGDDKWDQGGSPNYDGAILYSYVPADVIIGTDWLGQPVYGSAWDGIVYGGNQNAGYEDSVDSGYPEDYMLYVFSNDPRKNNVGWWL